LVSSSAAWFKAAVMLSSSSFGLVAEGAVGVGSLLIGFGGLQ